MWQSNILQFNYVITFKAIAQSKSTDINTLSVCLSVSLSACLSLELVCSVRSSSSTHTASDQSASLSSNTWVRAVLWLYGSVTQLGVFTSLSVLHRTNRANAFSQTKLVLPRSPLIYSFSKRWSSFRSASDTGDFALGVCFKDNTEFLTGCCRLQDIKVTPTLICFCGKISEFLEKRRPFKQ